VAFPAEILRDGVKTIKDLTGGIQVLVQHRAWQGYTDASGTETFSDPISRRCIVSTQQKELQTSSGETVTVMATLNFLGDVEPNGAVGRKEPFDPRDIIVLPDGFTGPIIDTPSGVMDPKTNRGFTHKVMLGKP
jgi:hypothetical protein